ncbi:MAG: histidinol dehydrogenase, partial [Ktedonobacteraceae bacterium]
MIHFYELARLDATQRQRLLRRAEVQIDELIEYVRPIVAAVRERGDEALLEFTAKFDRVQLDPARLRVSRAEIEQAHTTLDPRTRAALAYA